MNSRRVTNLIRYFMDEWIPPAIRDSKWFMYPFYYYAYRGKSIEETMNLKANFFRWTEREVADFYTRRNTRFSSNRATDLSAPCLDYIFSHLPEGGQSMLDVGCGRGYFLAKAAEKGFRTTGCDVIPDIRFPHSKYERGSVESLPFADDEFDVVVCSHTLEHVVHFDRAILELKRVARKTLCIVVPCQRAYFYTLDEHIRFFPYKEALEQEGKFSRYTCEKIHGDLVLIADMEWAKLNPS